MMLSTMPNDHAASAAAAAVGLAAAMRQLGVNLPQNGLGAPGSGFPTPAHHQLFNDFHHQFAAAAAANSSFQQHLAAVQAAVPTARNLEQASSSASSITTSAQMALSTSATAAALKCIMVNCRGKQIAAFDIDGVIYLCLPQAYELFLRDYVGGLHTVYTKLKRLAITPIVCTVDHVRLLRGLGAIQSGVNRCKLLAASDFEVLYEDCTRTSARPGRPPKRSTASGSGLSAEDDEPVQDGDGELEEEFCNGNAPDSSGADADWSKSSTQRHHSTPAPSSIAQGHHQHHNHKHHHDQAGKPPKRIRAGSLVERGQPNFESFVQHAVNFIPQLSQSASAPMPTSLDSVALFQQPSYNSILSTLLAAQHAAATGRGMQQQQPPSPPKFSPMFNQADANSQNNDGLLRLLFAAACQGGGQNNFPIFGGSMFSGGNESEHHQTAINNEIVFAEKPGGVEMSPNSSPTSNSPGAEHSNRLPRDCSRGPAPSAPTVDALDLRAISLANNDRSTSLLPQTRHELDGLLAKLQSAKSRLVQLQSQRRRTEASIAKLRIRISAVRRHKSSPAQSFPADNLIPKDNNDDCAIKVDNTVETPSPAEHTVNST